jgi:hypothetical protein
MFGTLAKEANPFAQCCVTTALVVELSTRGAWAVRITAVPGGSSGPLADCLQPLVASGDLTPRSALPASDAAPTTTLGRPYSLDDLFAVGRDGDMACNGAQDFECIRVQVLAFIHHHEVIECQAVGEDVCPNLCPDRLEVHGMSLGIPRAPIADTLIKVISAPSVIGRDRIQREAKIGTTRADVLLQYICKDQHTVSAFRHVKPFAQPSGAVEQRERLAGTGCAHN